MMRIIKDLIEAIKYLDNSIQTLISKHEETYQIQLEQKQILSNFITVLSSHLSVTTKLELERRKKETDWEKEILPTADDLRY